MITTTLKSSYHWKNLVPIYLRKKRPGLSQNRTEKQIMPFTTTVNWLFNDAWCHFAIGCFN